MDLLEIQLKSPIGSEEVIYLRSELIAVDRHEYLIIDTGNYDFVSFEVLKQFKNLLLDLEPCLMKFKKIAIVHSPWELSEEESKHRYMFISKEKAVEWLLSGNDKPNQSV